MISVRHTRSGFTLIEILIAIALVVLMGALVVPRVFKALESGRKKATVAQLRGVKNAINTFYADTGSFPETLKDLIQKPSNEELAAKWEGPYVEGKKVPTDGWDKPLQYHPTPEGENPFELYSYGSSKGKAVPKEKWLDVWKL